MLRAAKEGGRDHREDGQEPGGLALVLGLEPHVTDRPHDEALVLGPYRGHVVGQPIPDQRRQHRQLAARGRCTKVPDRFQPDREGIETARWVSSRLPTGKGLGHTNLD